MMHPVLSKLTVRRVFLVLMLSCGLAIPALAQVQIEINLGLNLYDIQGAESEAEWEISGTGATGDTLLKGEWELTIPTSILFGVYLGYLVIPQVVIGAEFAFFKAEADRGAERIQSSKYYIDKEEMKVDLQVARVGPAFRFYLGNRMIKPFVQAGVAYTGLTIDADDFNEKMKESLLDISFGLGVHFYVVRSAYFGAYARGDYFMNIKESEIKNHVIGGGDVLNTKTGWFPVSVVFSLGFVY